MALLTNGIECGLNADWCVKAWHFGPSEKPNETSGDVYVIDNEDSSFHVVRRFYDSSEMVSTLRAVFAGGVQVVSDEDETQTLAIVGDFETAVSLANKAVRNLNPKPNSNRRGPLRRRRREFFKQSEMLPLFLSLIPKNLRKRATFLSYSKALNLF